MNIYSGLVLTATVKPLNSGQLWVLKKFSVIKRCPLMGVSLTKIVIFGTKHFVRYSTHARYSGCPLLRGFTVFCQKNMEVQTWKFWSIQRRNTRKCFHGAKAYSLSLRYFVLTLLKFQCFRKLTHFKPMHFYTTWKGFLCLLWKGWFLRGWWKISKFARISLSVVFNETDYPRQKRIRNSVKHLWCSAFKKIVNGF